LELERVSTELELKDMGVELQVENLQKIFLKLKLGNKLLMHGSFKSSALKGGTVIFQKYDNYIIYFF